MTFFLNRRLAAQWGSGIVTAVAVAVGAAMPAIAQDQTVWLRDNEETTVTGYFLQGEDIFASCDDDCNDVDLFLFNEMGVMVAADDATNTFPSVTAPYEGTFVLRVNVPSCNHGAGCSVARSRAGGLMSMSSRLSSPLPKIISRFSTFCNSRTLPGQW